MIVPYRSLRDAALACIRIYGPLNHKAIDGHLKGWSRSGLLAASYLPRSVDLVLADLRRDGEVELVGTDNWRALPGKLERSVAA